MKCGGCTCIDLPYEAQLEKKKAFADNCLKEFGKTECIIGMEHPFNYRNKAISTFATGDRGVLINGIYEQASHRVVKAEDCLLQDKRINEIIKSVRFAASKCKYKAYNEDTGTGLLRHVVVRRGAKSGEVSVTVVTPSKFLPGYRDFVKLVRNACPDVVTIVQNINPTSTSAVLGNTENILFGKGYITDELCGKRFNISSRAFYQVNSVQTEKLYELAAEFAGLSGKESIIDAYCGIGTIGISVSDKCKSVLGIELNADAVKNAKENAKQNNCANVSFLCGDAGKVMSQLASEGKKADVVFMDPPREGSTVEFMKSVISFSPRKIVYISCNPQTQARDLKFFAKHGYNVERMVAVDMFPHTEHVETVVLLSREKVDDYIRIAVHTKDLEASQEQ